MRNKRVFQVLLLAIGIPNLYTGLWAVVSPAHWFDRFPGFDPRLVSAEPPFNAHLAVDAGAGFLATGLVVLLAAIWFEALVVRVALITYMAHAIPHVVYHASHPAPGLSGIENLVSTGFLFTGVVVAGIMGVYLYRRSDRRSELSGWARDYD